MKKRKKKNLEQDRQDQQDKERTLFSTLFLSYPAYPAHPVLTLALLLTCLPHLVLTLCLPNFCPYRAIYATVCKICKFKEGCLQSLA